MKEIISLSIGVVILFGSLVLLLNTNQASAEGKNEFVKGEVLVKFKDGVSSSDIDRTHRQLGGKIKQTIPGIGVQVVEVKGNVSQAVSAYAKEGLVEYAEPNFIAEVLETQYHPTDEHYVAGKQWALHNTGQVFDDERNLQGSNDADIDAPEACWQEINSSSQQRSTG